MAKNYGSSGVHIVDLREINSLTSWPPPKMSRVRATAISPVTIKILWRTFFASRA